MVNTDFLVAMFADTFIPARKLFSCVWAAPLITVGIVGPIACIQITVKILILFCATSFTNLHMFATDVQNYTIVVNPKNTIVQKKLKNLTRKP